MQSLTLWISKKTALFGMSEGGPMSALFAATYPERVSALVMYGSYPRWIEDQDYPWGLSRAKHEAAMNAFERHWGTPIGINAFAPSVAKDESCQNWWARMLREGANSGAAIALYRMNIEIDIRPVLPSIRVPTLLLHRTGDRLIDVGNSRYMAERIPNAKFVELEGIDHMPMFGDSEAVLGEIQEFVTGLRPGPARESALATILFVDIVRSTEKVAALGDARWHALLAAFYDLAKLELERSRGRLINTMGDAVFASFDGPARAIRCACSIRDRSRTLGLTVRAGLHTGECEIIDGKIGGMAVHIGARVAGQAEPGEVIVSSTAKDRSPVRVCGSPRPRRAC